MAIAAGPWELAQILVKLLIHAGMAGTSGGMLVWWLMQRSIAHTPVEAAGILSWPAAQQHSLLRYMLVACAAGILATLLLCLLQAGAINQAGLAGMFDRPLLRLLADTSIGHGIAFKLAGFIVAALALAGLLYRTPQVCSPWLLATGALALLLFATSFAVLGHVAQLGLSARLAVGLHVAAVLVWIGALLPLQGLCGNTPLAVLQPLLRLFGKVGWVLVGSLLVAGGWVLWQLLGNPVAILDTVYGQLMLAKLLLACCLLALAALNKFRLVPALTDPAAPSLRRSIAAELVLALLILLLTATLSTVTGPPILGSAHPTDLPNQSQPIQLAQGTGDPHEEH
jgi:putative copper resistance protein D